MISFHAPETLRTASQQGKHHVTVRCSLQHASPKQHCPQACWIFHDMQVADVKEMDWEMNTDIDAVFEQGEKVYLDARLAV